MEDAHQESRGEVLTSEHCTLGSISSVPESDFVILSGNILKEYRSLTLSVQLAKVTKILYFQVLGSLSPVRT